jgi:sulfate transport system permease protein
VLPGFGISMGYAVFYLSVLVLIPLAALPIKSAGLGWQGFWDAVTAPRVLASYQLTFGASFIAALVNLVFGTVVAWVLVRYRFPGRRLLDACIDLPFALPTAVAGIALTTIYAPTGPLGGLFAKVGIKTAYSPVGVFIALLFIGLPFVVRSIQPVLQDLDREVEEAAETLGATNFQRVTQVVLPAVMPALLTGVGLAFARAVGEYGSVIC